MNNSSNTTDSPATDGLQRQNYQTVPQLVPIAVLILITNGIVFLLFCKTRNLRTPANYLLFSLALSDVMTGLVNIPLFLCQLIRGYHVSATLFCASTVFHNVISFSVAYHITAITAEKYLAVVNPFGRNMMTKRTVAKTALVVWLWSTFLGSVPSSWFDKWWDMESLALYLEAGYNIFCLVVVFLLPFTFILYAYSIMFKAVSSTAGLTKSMRRKDTRTFKKASNEKKCLIILLTMAVAFAICWLPWFTMKLIYSLVNIELITEQGEHMVHLSQVFVIVRYLSSAINPLLYTFFKKDFWSAFRVVVLKKKHPRRSSMSMRAVSVRSRGSEQVSTLLLPEHTGKTCHSTL